MHVLATLAVLALLNVIGFAIAAAFYVDFVNQQEPAAADVPRHAPLGRAEAQALAERFAPILRLDSRELFVPVRQSAYVRNTRLRQEQGKLDATVSDSPTVDSLPATEGTCVRASGCFYYLDVRGVEPAPPKHSQLRYALLADHVLRHGEQPAVHFHVVRYADTGEYAIQYWFLYFFNFRLNEHESDWEQITVRLDEDRKPVEAFYSEHNGGEVTPWARVARDGDHPIVFPALGSHANYFGVGRHRVKIVCRRVIAAIGVCLRGNAIVVDLADGKGRELRPGSYSLRRFEGPTYVGSYGSGNYVVLTRKPDVLADPRTRAIWSDPLRAFS